VNDQVYSTILDTAKSVLNRSRLPSWLKKSSLVNDNSFLLDDIISQVLDEQAIKPEKGKRLIRRVTRIARTIIRSQWHEVRWNADGKRLSKSVLRIVSPVRSEEKAKTYLSPLDRVGTDIWGRLTDFVPVYRGGSICGLASTPKNKNLVEERLIAWLDWKRQEERWRKRNRMVVAFAEGYFKTRRQGTPKPVRERVRFHRLKARLQNKM
jgi:hypothetical protein